MGYKYIGGQALAVGYSVQANRPLDEKEIVLTFNDLFTVPNVYEGIGIKVADQDYAEYTLIAADQTNADNWVKVQGVAGVPGPAGPAGPQGVQGVQGVAGPQGAKGIKGDQGERGLQGIQGPIGLRGPIGLTGATGPQGPQGLQGIQGVQGPNGQKGDTGDRGPVGPAGAQGPTGAQGLQGPAGAQGAQGPIGPTGIQGVPGPKGDEGDQGPAGQGVTITGSATVTVIKGKTGVPGELWIATDSGTDSFGNPVVDGDGLAWQTTPEGWINIGPVQGPKGDTGATGPQGVPGPKGDQGVQGATGVQGPTGATGAQGPKGDKGDTGDTGAQGVKGDTGAAGATGPAGPGVATGGLTGQVLAKKSGTNYDTHWIEQAQGTMTLDTEQTVTATKTMMQKWVFDDAGTNSTGEIEMIPDPNATTGDVMRIQSDAPVRINAPKFVAKANQVAIGVPGSQIGNILVVAGVDTDGNALLGYQSPTPPSYSVDDSTTTPVTIKVSGTTPPTNWVALGLEVTLGQDLPAGSGNIAFNGIFTNTSIRTGVVEFGLRVNGVDLDNNIIVGIGATYNQTIAFNLALINSYVAGDVMGLIARVNSNSNNEFNFTMANSVADPGFLRIYKNAGGTAGVTVHGQLLGLDADDHLQYHTDARGDARYPLKSVSITGLASVNGGGDLSSNRSFQLTNDLLTPAPNSLYGTDNSGNRGWFPRSSTTTYTGVWDFQDPTTAPPTGTSIRRNATTPAAVTILWITENDINAKNHTSEFTVLAKNDIFTFKKEGNTSLTVEFKLTGAGIDRGSYWEFPVVYVNGTGETVVNGDNIEVSIAHNNEQAILTTANTWAEKQTFTKGAATGLTVSAISSAGVKELVSKEYAEAVYGVLKAGQIINDPTYTYASTATINNEFIEYAGASECVITINEGVGNRRVTFMQAGTGQIRLVAGTVSFNNPNAGLKTNGQGSYISFIYATPFDGYVQPFLLSAQLFDPVTNIINITASTYSYTPRETYNNEWVDVNNAGGCTVTLNSGIAKKVVTFVQSGAGKITFANGAGVTIVTPETKISRKAGATVAAIYLSATRILLAGNLELL